MDLSPLANQVNSLRTIRVGQGLFVLRYVSSKAGLGAPVVSVSAPGADVAIISPTAGDARLVAPGDGLVVHAARDALINVMVTPLRPNGSCDAELVLERISTTIQSQPSADHGLRQSAFASAATIEILAHVARRGDVVVPAGEWICGPDLPMAIEGIEIRWPDRPQGLDIVCGATVNARGRQTLPDKHIGAFQGSRGRAAPITTLTLALTGPGSEDYSLSCDAAFLGLPVMSVSGKSCILSGTTGHEPLVGLRLSIVSHSQAASTRRDDPRAVTVANPAVLPAKEGNRVRVFRTPARRNPTPAMLP